MIDVFLRQSTLSTGKRQLAALAFVGNNFSERTGKIASFYYNDTGSCEFSRVGRVIADLILPTKMQSKSQKYQAAQRILSHFTTPVVPTVVLRNVRS